MASHTAVLNLIITGIPSILIEANNAGSKRGVLNLIITGIPSILHEIACFGYIL